MRLTMLSRLGDVARLLRVLDIADIISFATRKFFRLIEILALPVLLLGTLALVITAASRAIAWSSMTHLVVNPKDRIQAETQIFITLGQILGGGFILTGLYFTGKSYILARRGQFGERLGVAIEGLGDDNLQRRVGSILSLGAMVGDERGNVRVITGVLCTFIRTATTNADYRREYSDAAPRADVQAAISVLVQMRRRISWRNWINIDLRESVLPNAKFDEGDLRYAFFQDCHLSNASFFRSRLSHANFSRANLTNSDFNQTDLRHTSFFQSISIKCKFRRSNIIGANLTRADLTECSFDGARVINSTFSQSTLDNSTFRGARFRGGDYHKVNPETLKAMGIVKLRNPWLSGEKLAKQLF
jgi:uncharacterized protein YjbI with pentapeptide repeats